MWVQLPVGNAVAIHMEPILPKNLTNATNGKEVKVGLFGQFVGKRRRCRAWRGLAALAGISGAFPGALPLAGMGRTVGDGRTVASRL